jgi:hypothetical protein
MNTNEAMTLANTLATSGLIPTALQKKPQDILVVLLAGQEYGLQPMQSLRAISVVQGKPVLGAEFMMSMALQNPACEYFTLIESTTKIATFETKRKGCEPVKMSFSMEDAARAGLSTRQNWKSHPAAMLRARCISALSRVVYPDSISGAYCHDEGDEINGYKEEKDVTPKQEKDIAILQNYVPRETPEIASQTKWTAGAYQPRNSVQYEQVVSENMDQAPVCDASSPINNEQRAADSGTGLLSEVCVPSGKNTGKPVTELTDKQLKWYAENWKSGPPEFQSAVIWELYERERGL